MNNIQTDDGGRTFVCYTELNLERKKELLLTLRQKNKGLNKKIYNFKRSNRCS